MEIWVELGYTIFPKVGLCYRIEVLNRIFDHDQLGIPTPLVNPGFLVRSTWDLGCHFIILTNRIEIITCPKKIRIRISASQETNSKTSPKKGSSFIMGFQII